ncbi:MAG: methyltransferase domain-containing protein [Desulfovibrionaceae bacterium]|nr:methyltransferase domain-containing protein [Desulfovibrionaceae bacterium]
MINAEKVRKFWLDRGKKYQKIAYDSIGNLEENEQLLKLKVRLEQEQVLPRLGLTPDMDVLDLGAGVGQWSFRFSPKVHSVTAVEFSRPLIDIAEKEALERGIKNVYFLECSVEQFIPETTWPLVFISGLFVYLNDAQAEAAANVVVASIRSGGRLFLRDGTSILGKRYIIDDRWSDVLHTEYSAVYRTRDEYVAMFTSRGLLLREDANMFAENVTLNKYSETRLRFYVFDKIEG